ncbi:hypothetical protein GCM10017608_18730 [Agromyces luteolus]|uniref:DUF6036 family nucleotidyltransferase n=1 Tax=Agromyces luteolus TaxID=88373 RepID=UPI00197AC30F|nr:DUF6036 family nucleotidyltransferase [Agromyces luteolus]GLK27939.1 hypothetical protein GCM10017608_18730 [Agromyces luteolus]
MILLDRDDLIDGLRELVAELHAEGNPVGLRIVGGGALALRHFDRRTTVDVDAVKVSPGDEAEVVAAAERIAERRGWQLDWLNFKASQLAPWWGREIRWEPIHHDGLVTIEVAPADALLAMKLKASRPGRDTDDIRHLLALCAIGSVEEADELFGEFFPGDSLTDRAWGMVENILAGGPLVPPSSPPPPDLRPESE